MSTYNRIIHLLKENNIIYTELRHAPVRTSEEAAKVRPDISLSQGAKALIVRYKSNEEHKYAMLVIPGDKRFDSKKVKLLLNSKDLTFASTEDVVRITNGVVPGGVPPFGNLFGLDVFVNPSLLQNEEIAFNAGDKSITIIM